MRYVLLLLILCLTFFALNSASKYQHPLSFLSSGKGSGVATNGSNTGHRPHSHWATASMMPLKGGPSAGTGLSQASLQGDAPAANTTERSIDRSEAALAAAAAIGTPSSVAVAPAGLQTKLSTSNHPNIQSSIQSSNHSSNQTSIQSSPSVKTGSLDQDVVVSTSASAADGLDAAANATAANQVATTEDAQDLSSPIAYTPDYMEMDLAALPDVVAVQPAAGPVGLSADANAFAIRVADSIRNSLVHPNGVQFGGIAGLNWSGADASTATASRVTGTPLTGFTLGLFADIPLANRFSLRPDLVYSYEGFQPDVNGQRVNIHMAYLNLPVDLVYRTNLFGQRFFVGAGPYVSYGLNGTYTLKGINTDMQFGNNYANGDNARRLDFGANVMGGMLMDRNFILGASFNYGLNNIAPNGSSMSVKTRSFGVSIGYVFRNRQNTPTFKF